MKNGESNRSSKSVAVAMYFMKKEREKDEIGKIPR
jgi:hypothetical protein